MVSQQKHVDGENDLDGIHVREEDIDLTEMFIKTTDYTELVLPLITQRDKLKDELYGLSHDKLIPAAIKRKRKKQIEKELNTIAQQLSDCTKYWVH